MRRRGCGIRASVLLAALLLTAGSGAGAQGAAGAPEPIVSLGQPPRWQNYVGALLRGGSGRAGAMLLAGTEQFALNPVVGLLAGDGEVYAGTGLGGADAGARLIARTPAFALGAGLDWDVTRGRADLLLTWRSAILRGGLLGAGSMLRVDWLPTREGTVALGVHLPVGQPLAGRTRPRHVDAQLPSPSDVPTVHGALPADVEVQMRRVDSAARLIGACGTLWTDDDVRVVREAGSCTGSFRAYDGALAAAFGLATHGATGPALAARARAVLLDDVLFPFDTLLGRPKRPGDRIDGLTSAAHDRFARWLADSSGLDATARAAALAVQGRMLESVERVHATLLDEGGDSRFVWLPLALGLAPSQYDEQSEIDALIARAVGQPFTDGNRLTYLQSRDLPLEIAHSILAARDYHVLWTHDLTSRRHVTHDLDNIGFETVTNAYFPALTAAVKRYDATGRFPAYMIYLDQYFYEPRGGRLWMTMLEDPLHASVALPGENAERQALLRARQAELRAAVAGSARLQRDAARFGGEAWLARTVKVHVNITDPSDFSFRSARIVPPFLFAPDNLMRDHRKIAFYDVTERDPWRGGLLIMGTGVGEQFASATWEDRGFWLRGPATLEARAALRRVIRAHGLTDAEVPPPLRQTATAVVDGGNVQPWVGRALQVHNEVGWGPKHGSIVRAMLYDLAQPGADLVIPDPQWVSRQYAAMLAGAAARGAHVYVVAPALANAPTPEPGLMGLAHDVLLHLLEIHAALGASLEQSGGELRVGLFTAKADLGDPTGRRDEVREGVERAPWIRTLFPFSPAALARLEGSEVRAAANPDNATLLAKDQVPRLPKVHQKTQLVARAGAIATLLRQPGWDVALAAAVDAQAAETARLTEVLTERSTPIDTVAEQTADEIMRRFVAAMPEEQRRRASLYFTAGTQNQDPRGMALDGEATLVTSGIQGAAGMVDLYRLMARSTWVTSRAELDRLLPPAGFIARLSRLVWPTM